MRIGSLDTFGGKIALDRGQPGLRLRIERGTAGRHQYRPVGKIRSGCQQAVLSDLDLATDAKQVDLPCDNASIAACRDGKSLTRNGRSNTRAR